MNGINACTWWVTQTCAGGQALRMVLPRSAAKLCNLGIEHKLVVHVLDVKQHLAANATYIWPILALSINAQGFPWLPCIVGEVQHGALSKCMSIGHVLMILGAPLAMSFAEAGTLPVVQKRILWYVKPLHIEYWTFPINLCWTESLETAAAVTSDRVW